MQLIKLTEIQANPNQPRKHFDEQALAELAQSIKVEGVMSPIMIRPIGDKFEIVQGERRFRAAQQAGLTEIPSIIREVDEQEAFHLAVIENIQREQMTPIEEAQAFMKYVEMGFTHEQIAQKVSKSRTYITSKLRILNLPPEIQHWVAIGKLSDGHAKKLLTAKNDICRLMDVCYFLHGTENPFEYIMRLFMYRYKDSEKISVKDVENFLDWHKYHLINNELRWLTFQAYPQELKSEESKIQQGIQAVDICFHLGANYRKITVEDIKFSFEHVMKYKSEKLQGWKVYKAMEEWTSFVSLVDFDVENQDEIIEQLKKRDLYSELIVY